MRKLCSNKLCSYKRPQPLTNFGKRTGSTDGLYSQCKNCINRRQREWNNRNPDRITQQNLKQHYGITPLQYQEMFKAQRGNCAICGRNQSEFKRKLCVDHDHITRRVRSLLCTGCNTALGGIKESIEVGIALVEYLRGHKTATSKA
ncbi:MAG: endonuclease VII domain-containing protein [Candidatus Saccharimonadales bacterium]